MNGLRFGVDEDGNYGFYKVGADSVTPFSNIIDKLVNGSWETKQIYSTNQVTTFDVTNGKTYLFCVSCYQSNVNVSGGDMLFRSQYVTTYGTAGASCVLVVKATSDTITLKPCNSYSYLQLD